MSPYPLTEPSLHADLSRKVDVQLGRRQPDVVNLTSRKHRLWHKSNEQIMDCLNVLKNNHIDKLRTYLEFLNETSNNKFIMIC